MTYRFTTKGVIFGILGLQLLLATMLMGRDLTSAWATINWPSTQPRFDTPVLPGDQTRRYRPSDMPLREADLGNPDRPYRSTGDMPARLAFELNDDVLNLTGTIAPGDAERMAEQMADVDIQRVRLNSPGGSVQDALEIGRMLRKARLETLLGAGDICLSACPYVLASGIERRVHGTAQVGVHQHYFGQNSALPAFLAVEQIQRGQADVMRYLAEMDVDTLIMQHALNTPADEIYVLLNTQLTEYRLATEVVE
ncbi:MAG: hypothetical protein ABJ327_03485 [Litoreibacter sp.]